MKKKPTTPYASELRRQAEARLSQRKKKAAAHPAMEADTQRLIHELEVHQIELEMQNKELQQSRAELEALLCQYTDLYDFAPVGYFTLGLDGAILQVNLTGANLLGVERTALINRRFGVFVSGQSRTTFNAFLDNVFTSRSKETCEVMLLKDRHNTLWVHMEATTKDSGEVCHAVAVDINERKKAEDELRYLSVRNSLTMLYNHGFFMEEMARLERGRQFPVSIVMADVDHLKEINDLHGHASGDALLKRVAQVLTSAFRAEDVVAHIGGDEFAVLLPDTNVTTAKVLLQRVRQIIQKNNAAHPGAPIRLSLGVSTAENPMSLSDVLKEADASMYRDKQGRYAHLSLFVKYP